MVIEATRVAYLFGRGVWGDGTQGQIFVGPDVRDCIARAAVHVERNIGAEVHAVVDRGTGGLSEVKIATESVDEEVCGC
jgi:hypothetical protein